MSTAGEMKAIPLTIKWGKETVHHDLIPAAGVKGLKSELSEKTGVPADRMKLMAKSKGLWKGVLKDETDLTAIDWKKACGNSNGGAPKPLQVLLVGSAAKVTAPAKKTVFIEDLPPEEVAKVQEPAGMVNLGNTCYLNSVVQCLRSVPPLRKGLEHYAPPLDRRNGPASLLVQSLRDTYGRLDRQADPFQPIQLVQAVKMAFPQFAQRGPHGQPMQQDAEEFYSGVLATVADETKGGREAIARVLGDAVTDGQLQGADNLIDALFGMKMKETLTCDELDSGAGNGAVATKDGEGGEKDKDAAAAAAADAADATAAAAASAMVEPPVVSYDLHRKLVCNIQGGSDGNASATNVSHVQEGVQLSLSGKIEKRSDVLGRDAVWTRTQRIARLPPYLTVQFGRFYWKATPDSADHAGVKCKVMKPVAFNADLDVYEFCTPEIRAVLKVARDKALAAEEDRVNKKLKGEDVAAMDIDTAAGNNDDGNKKGDGQDNDKMETSVEEDDEEAAALQAALAMSMQTEDNDKNDDDQDILGPGLPDDFRGIYELFAVVTHKGRDADGGHYMAWVKAPPVEGQKAQKIADTDQANEDWYVFDDDEVSPCKTEDILKLKGGGDWHMSYLNFYRAKK